MTAYPRQFIPTRTVHHRLFCLTFCLKLPIFSYLYRFPLQHSAHKKKRTFQSVATYVSCLAFDFRANFHVHILGEQVPPNIDFSTSVPTHPGDIETFFFPSDFAFKHFKKFQQFQFFQKFDKAPLCMTNHKGLSHCGEGLFRGRGLLPGGQGQVFFSF